MQLNPYLLFNGNCAEALKFYEETLGGKIETLSTSKVRPQRSTHRPSGETRCCTRACRLEIRV
jgi:PhnB protein